MTSVSTKLERLVRIVGAHPLDTAVLVQPAELAAYPLDTIESVVDVVHHLLWRVGIHDRPFTVLDLRQRGEQTGDALSFAELEVHRVVLTVVELAGRETTLDDLCATIADLRMEMLVSGDHDALEDVDSTPRAVYLGLGLLMVPQPENPASDVTRDEWLELLALWCRLRGVEHPLVSSRIAALPDRATLRASLGVSPHVPPSPPRAVPPLDAAARAACIGARQD